MIERVGGWGERRFEVDLRVDLLTKPESFA